ncbi:MAG: hypothetical protein LBM65_07910 [Oscillospiraceae bacterium]|jgi:hypothetical protein|nr:hypothetical protein [Oscillospiraceae bacterium]
MKKLILALNMLKHFLLQSGLLVAEIVFMLIIITTLINSYNWEMKEYNAFQIKELDNGIYYYGLMQDVPIEEDKANQKALMDYLDAQPEFVGISDIDQLSFTTKTADGTELYYSVYAADRNTCKLLGIDENLLFDEEKIKQGILPAVVFCKDKNDFEKGKTYPGEFYDIMYFAGQAEQIDKDATLEVVDIINSVTRQYVRYRTKGSAVAYNAFTSYLQKYSMAIYVPKVEELLGGYEEPPYWITLNPGTTPERRAEIIENVSKYGSFLTKEQLDAKTMEGVNYRLNKNVTNSIILCVLSIISLFVLSFLSAMQLSKRFSIYYICGLSKAKAIGLYALFMYLVGAIAILVYYAITIVCYYFPFNTKMVLDFYKYQSINTTGLLSILICFAMITLFSIIPFVLNYRKTSLQMYRL